MDKELITIKIEGHINGDYQFHDYREIRVSATRGEVSTKLDAIYADIEASFEQ